MKLSKLIHRISGEGAAAWDIHTRAQRAAANGEDVIVLSIGDPDFPTPAPIIERAVEALRSGDTHYAAVPGRDKLRQAIARDFQQRTGVPTDADNVFVFAGTQNALFAASLILLDETHEVIVLEPMYVTYEACLRLGGATMVPVAQPAANGFRPDIELIKAAITDKTQAIVITTPNNPTGVVLNRDELGAIAALAIEHDLWVISDEVYTDLIFEGEHISMAALPGMAERTITVNSLSKSHAMTGWRTGWTIGPKALFPHYDNLGLCMLYGLPGFVQEAAITALTEERDASLQMRDIYKRRRDLVCAELAKAEHLPVLKSQAAMYVMVDVRHYYENAKTFSRDLYEEKGVSVLDAGAFGNSARGWVRLCFTLDEDSLVEGCRRIVDFLNHKK
jgi:arginine:pyruvate transaminase